MFVERELREHELAYLTRLNAAGFPNAGPAASYAETLMRRGMPVLFDVRHLAHVTNLRVNVLASIAARPSPNYRLFTIPKKAGGSREITAPRPALKHVQHWIHDTITSNLQPHQACHGFGRGTSIITNAQPHAGAKVVLKLDIRDFFPSVPQQSVYRTFRRIGYSRDVSRLLTRLTVLDGGLPQGAPTSPQLANLAAFRLDTRLAGLAAKRDLEYTRYADDLTFSGPRVTEANVKRLIERIIRDSGFRPHERKARYLHANRRISVTGIVVNEKVNWPRNLRRWLRQETYYLRRFGVDSHLERRGIDRRNYKEFVYGHAFALHAVRPDEAKTLIAGLDEVDWPY